MALAAALVSAGCGSFPSRPARPAQHSAYFEACNNIRKNLTGDFDRLAEAHGVRLGHRSGYGEAYPGPGGLVGRVNAYEHWQWECGCTPDEAARFMAALRTEFEKPAHDTGTRLYDSGELVKDGRLQEFHFKFEAGNAHGAVAASFEANDEDLTKAQFPYKLHLSLGEDVK